LYALKYTRSLRTTAAQGCPRDGPLNPAKVAGSGEKNKAAGANASITPPENPFLYHHHPLPLLRSSGDDTRTG
jgi:hypothetical protein